MEAKFRVRDAVIGDVKLLMGLEETCFRGDRLSARSFRWMITKAHSAVRVLCDPDGGPVGYGILLFHRATSMARLYSIAVDPGHRGSGAAAQLLEELENVAALNGCAYIRLEVRQDNKPAIKLYEKQGYYRFDTKEDYYEDHAQALCYEKKLAYHKSKNRLEAPYYRQTTSFTCGPASLMMAMGALDPATKLTQRLELQIWREATTIFMTSGHGGCGPRGLGLSAHRRGYRVEIYLSQKGPLFVQGVRDPHKKAVIQLVHHDFQEQLKENGIHFSIGPMTSDKMREIFERGGVPLVLISTYRLTKSKAPHWVVLTAIDDQFIYFHDPEFRNEGHGSVMDSMHIPISIREFEKMAKFGSSNLKACVAVFAQ